MEVMNASQFVGPDGTDLTPLRSEKPTIFAIDDNSSDAEMFLEQRGRELHPIFDRDKTYLQQRFTLPTRSAFK